MLIVSIMFGGKFKSGGGHEWNIFNEISVKNSSFKPGNTIIDTVEKPYTRF